MEKREKKKSGIPHTLVIDVASERGGKRYARTCETRRVRIRASAYSHARATTAEFIKNTRPYFLRRAAAARSLAARQPRVRRLSFHTRAATRKKAARRVRRRRYVCICMYDTAGGTSHDSGLRVARTATSERWLIANFR